MMTISELASRSGVPAQIVRYYARIGLIEPAGERGNGYREFDPRDAPRLRFIRAAKQLGFTLAEIRQITGRATRGESPCPEVRAILRRRIHENRARLDAMQALQSRMEAALETWEQMPDREPDGECICHLIEAVGADGAGSLGEKNAGRAPEGRR